MQTAVDSRYGAACSHAALTLALSRKEEWAARDYFNSSNCFRITFTGNTP